MARKVQAYQLFDGSNIPDKTRRNHLWSAFADQPDVALDLMVKVLNKNDGMDFVSMVKEHSVTYIPRGSDGTFSWKLDYRVDTNHECVGAWRDSQGTVAIAPGDTDLGVNQSMFYLDFDGSPFQRTGIIEGMNPDVDRLYIYSVQSIGNDRIRVGVQLANSKGPDDAYEYEQVAEGTRWSKFGGAVAKYDADDGFGISFNTPTRASGELSSFRMKHKIHGHMVDYAPKAFHVPGENGKGSRVLWLTAVEYEFMRTIRQTEANIVMYGRSNKWDDGTRGNIDHNAEMIHIGPGWKEQILNSNRYYFSGTPSFEEIQNIAIEASVDKLSMGTRTFIIKAGEYGLIALSKSAREFNAKIENANGISDTTGRNITWSNNDITVRVGQVQSVVTYNGIRFIFMLDPSKDSGVGARNKLKLANLPGFASSYQYDIMGFGDMDEKTNMSIVRREGETPVFAVEEGIRGFFNNKGSFSAPKHVSNGVDASVLHYHDFGIGAMVKDPTKLISYGPEELPYS